MEKTFFKKLLPLMLFTLVSFSLLGNITGAELSDDTTEAATADSEWRLIVDGAVNQPLNLTFSDLAAMPRSTVYADLYCLETLVSTGNWTGVKLGYLLETAGLQSGAAGIGFFASDGYSTLLDISEAFSDYTIIAYELNSQPLSEHLRLVLPGKNGDQWIAWVTQITVSTVALDPAIDPSRPPQMPQPPSMPNATYTPQPSDQPSTPPADPSPSQEIDSTIPRQDFQDSNPPAYNDFALLAPLVAVIAATTAYLYLKRKK
jgi:DMSO/TMAO reductase YedYZ molybdopterin-dependent catalytic subunit